MAIAQFSSSPTDGRLIAIIPADETSLATRLLQAIAVWSDRNAQPGADSGPSKSNEEQSIPARHAIQTDILQSRELQVQERMVGACWQKPMMP